MAGTRKQLEGEFLGVDADAEQSLLSSAWLSGDADLVKKLEPNDFADDFCRWLFGKLRAVVDAGEPLDMVAVLRRVRAKGGRDGLPAHAEDDLEYRIAQLLTLCPSTAHKEYYFRTVRTERVRRASIRLSEMMRKRLTDGVEPPLEVLAWATKAVRKIQERGGTEQ